VLKGYLPVFAAIQLDQGPQALEWTYFGMPHLIPVVVATVAIVGHSKSIFLGFKGGKSAATGMGTMIAFCPMLGIYTFGTFLAMVFQHSQQCHLHLSAQPLSMSYLCGG
jgi:glycerol-3-phosphate acyltransferase PlsY